ADVLRLRLGDAAARGGLSLRVSLPVARHRALPALDADARTAAVALPLARLPRGVLRGPHQAAPRSAVGGPEPPRLALRDAAEPSAAVVLAAPRAALDARRRRRREPRRRARRAVLRLRPAARAASRGHRADRVPADAHREREPVVPQLADDRA